MYTPPTPVTVVRLMMLPFTSVPFSATVTPWMPDSNPFNVPPASASAYTVPEIVFEFTVTRSVSCAGSVSTLKASVPVSAPKSRSGVPSVPPASTVFASSAGSVSQKMRALFSSVVPAVAGFVLTVAE